MRFGGTPWAVVRGGLGGGWVGQPSEESQPKPQEFLRSIAKKQGANLAALVVPTPWVRRARGAHRTAGPRRARALRIGGQIR